MRSADWLRWPLLACLLAVTVAHGYHEQDEPSDGTVASFKPVAPPRSLPASVTFHLVDGGEIPIAAFRGQVVLLNLWASWCPPCLRELPALDRLQQRLGGDRFQVVALSIDAGGAPVATPFFERLGIAHLGLYVDPGKRIEAVLPVDVLPASFFIDRQGRVVSFLRSYVDWDDPRVDALVHGLIEAHDG